MWAGANSRDPIANLGNHGWWHLESALGGLASATTRPRRTSAHAGSRPSPTTRAANDGFGALADHSKYFDHDTESLYNIGQVVNGRYGAVREAGPVDRPLVRRTPGPGVGPCPGRSGHRRQAVSVRRLLAALLLVTALGSCTTTGGEDHPPGADPERAEARLERQRRDVRAAARTVLE